MLKYVNKCQKCQHKIKIAKNGGCPSMSKYVNASVRSWIELYEDVEMLSEIISVTP